MKDISFKTSKVFLRSLLFVFLNASLSFQAHSEENERITATPPDIAGLASIQHSLQRAIPEASKPLVLIRAEASSGSGVIVSPDGLVYTAAHVVVQENGDQSAKAVKAVLQNGEERDLELVSVDTENDAAIMKIANLSGFKDCALIGKTPSDVGEWVFALGHGNGFNEKRGAMVRLGRIVSLRNNLLKSDCKLVGGDSGGPLFNMKGELIGIHSRVGEDLEHNLHIPVSHFEKMLKKESLSPSRDNGSTGASLGFDKRLNGKEMLELIETIREKLQDSSAAFYVGNDIRGYGLVMSPNGHIMTKASLFPQDGEPYVRVGAARFSPITVLATDRATDLALVKIEVKEPLVPPSIDETIPGKGTIVISNGSSTRTERRAKIGVISGSPRPVAKTNNDYPFWGVTFSPPRHIQSVIEGGPAEKAGLKGGDEMIEVEGAAITKLEDLNPILEKKRPGDTISIKVRRGDQTPVIALTFGSRMEFLGEAGMPMSRNDMMSGDVSKRRDDFPLIIEHDTPLPSFIMGGPLLDLNGNVRGLNIARVNRAETFALPIKLVVETYRKLLDSHNKTP